MLPCPPSAPRIQHRSEERYLRYMSGIFVSEVFRGLWKPVLFFVALTLLFGGYSVALTNGLLPSWLPLPKIGIEAFSISIPVLSFLLVFRTNSAFQRWDESRRHWGLVANRARDLARMGTTHIHNPLLKDALIRWVQAFTWALKGHCRPGEAGDLRRRLDGLLSEEELSGLEHAKHRPAYCIQVLSRIVARARLPSPITLMFDRNLTEFHDITGACERILRTPIYLPYTRNTTRWLLLWLFCLPFALFTSMGFYAVPAVALIAFLLMGVEEIGVQIEEPFSILPLENICDVTCQTIKEIRERFPSLDTPVFSWESEADGLQRRDGEEGDGSSDGASSSGPAYAHTTARAGGGGVAVRAAAAGPVRPSSPSSYFKEEENYDVGVEPRLESSPWAA